MRFSDILKEAFILTWRNRWFWFAGFLIMPQLIGGYPIDMNFKPGDEFPLKQFMMLMVFSMGLGVVVLFAAAIIQPALTLATKSWRLGTPLKGLDALRSGFPYAGKCLALTLLQIGAFLLVMLMLGVPIVIAFINSIILGAVVALLFIPILIVIAFLVAIVVSYAMRNIILREMTVGDSISEGWRQFRATKGPSVGLLLTAILIPIVAITPLSFPISMAKFAMQLTSVGTTAVTVVFFTVVTILSIPIVGYFGAFSSVLWTIAFQEWYGDGSSAPNAKF